MKITKSKPAFVLGLIGGILTTLGGSCLTLFSTIANDIITTLGSSSQGFYVVLSWALFLGGILAIVASSFCLKKAKLGGILLLVAFGMTVAMSIYNITLITEASPTTITTIIFGAIPSILILIGGILGLIAKPKTIIDVAK